MWGQWQVAEEISNASALGWGPAGQDSRAVPSLQAPSCGFPCSVTVGHLKSTCSCEPLSFLLYRGLAKVLVIGQPESYHPLRHAAGSSREHLPLTWFCIADMHCSF